MIFLPFENITYHTSLDSEAILKKNNRIVEPKKKRVSGQFGMGNYKPYEGNIIDNSFTINKIIDYRNSCLPIIKGKIETESGNNTVKVTMMLHPFMMVFMCIWFGVIGIELFNSLPASLEDGIFNQSILIPLGMLIFGYGLTIRGFKHESIQSKKYLAELFEAEME